MKFFKWLFSTESKGKKYYPEIILMCYLVISTVLVMVLATLLKWHGIVGVIPLTNIVLFFLCMTRMINISDYNEKNNIRKGNIKFKFEPVLYKKSDIENWVTNTKAPDIIYVKGIDSKRLVTVEASFDIKGGKNVDKKIFINDKEIFNIEQFRYEIDTKCLVVDETIYVVAITDYNDPKLLKKVLKEIK